MAILGTFFKQPRDRLSLDLDFSKWLQGMGGDTIVSAVSEVDNTDLVIDLPLPMSTYVQQWYSGGKDGEKYKITVVATTAQGRIKEVDFYVQVRNL